MVHILAYNIGIKEQISMFAYIILKITQSNVRKIDTSKRLKVFSDSGPAHKQLSKFLSVKRPKVFDRDYS